MATKLSELFNLQKDVVFTCFFCWRINGCSAKCSLCEDYVI